MAKKSISIGDTGQKLVDTFNANFDAFEIIVQTTDPYNTSAFWIANKSYLIKDTLNIDNITIANGVSLRFINGGNFTKSGAGVINFVGEILIKSDAPCFFGGIKLTTTNGVKVVRSDWFDLEKQSATAYNTKSLATTTKNSTFIANHPFFTICWGAGIYVFSEASNNIWQLHIGAGRYNTCLHFPDSDGFVYSTTKARLTFTDFYIHSKGACFKIAASLPYAFTEFKHYSVSCFSETDFVWQRIGDSPIYHCEWEDFCGGTNNPDKGIFYGFGTTSNVMRHIWNTPSTFTNQTLTGNFKAVFYDTHCAVMSDSSFCYAQTIDHIYYRSGEVNDQGILVHLQNNRFEDVKKEIINIPCNALAAGNIYLISNDYATSYPTESLTKIQLRIARCKIRALDFNYAGLVFVEVYGNPRGNTSGYWQNYSNIDVVAEDATSPFDVYYSKANSNTGGIPILVVSPLTFPDIEISARPDNGQPRAIKEVIFVKNPPACTTANLPTLTSADRGFKLYDTTRGKEVLWNGTAWVNVDGNPL